MTTLSYTLRVVVPDEIDDDTMTEILEEAEDHDLTRQAKVGRYLGGFVSGAVADLSASLPEGFYAKVDDDA